MKISLVEFSLLIMFLSIAEQPMEAMGDERPNVVILFTDDHGTLDAGCYGATDLVTPNIDALAANGVRFTQAYADKFCCPSRAGLLTGRYPQRSNVDAWTQSDRHGSDSHNKNMKTEEVTLAEALKSAGYETALFGKWHLGAKEGHGPLDQGFDRFFGHLGGFIDNYRHYFLHGKGFHDLYEGEREIFRRGEYFPDLMVNEAIEYLDTRNDNPFFMMVAFNLPHYPEQPIGKYKNAYADLPMPRQSYARVVSTVDDYIGRILGKLDEKGLTENTIVILMGDNGHSAENNKGIAVEDHTSGYPKGHYYLAHGGGGYTGKWIGHKGDYFEGGIRVPAIISYPKILPRGARRDQIITVMDWFPTILELTKTPCPEVKLDGHSVLPVIEQEERLSAHETLHFGWSNGWAVREGDWKLIAKVNRAKQEIVHLGLHSLEGLQPEVKNYVEEYPEIVARLMELHEQWSADVYSDPVPVPSNLNAESSTLATEPIHVLVWDERQPRQAQAYDDYIGNEIVARLDATTDDLEFRSVALDDEAQGLAAGNLEWADVIVWWGHVRHSDVAAENSERVMQYLRRGDLDLIALHSSHWARPFVAAMNWRSIEDGRKHFAKIAGQKKLKLETVMPPRERTVPTHRSVVTPAFFSYKLDQKSINGVVHLPWCCFPDYRPDGRSGTIEVKAPSHPIAQGLPATFKVPQTEMYNEPFHVPLPDQVIFEETWERGERFRSGMVWDIEKGKVFYFRPGHETYPVYKQENVVKVLANACRWLGRRHPKKK